MCESTNTYSINTGNGYYGAYQFDLSTWRSVGGTGYPNNASAAEQDYRALYLYRMRGWEPWTCARILGLQEDSDGGSGVIPPRGGGGGGGGGGGNPPPTKPNPPAKPPTNSAPAWPGKQFHLGDTSASLRTWQLQLKKRGAPFEGTSYFGSKTLEYVKGIQRANSLCVCGYIGPKTWDAAWHGKMPTKAQLGGSSGGGSPAPPKPPSVKAPAWPGITFSYGDSSPQLKKWQLQMRKRGYPFDGTGNFGAKTLKYVKVVQRDNGLHVVGYIGPKTWAAAWTGK